MWLIEFRGNGHRERWEWVRYCCQRHYHTLQIELDNEIRNIMYTKKRRQYMVYLDILMIKTWFMWWLIMYNIYAVRMSDMQRKNHVNPKTSFADAVAGYLSLNVVVLRRCCTAGFEPGQIKGKLCDSLGALHLLLLLLFNQHYLYFVFSQGPFCHLLKNWLIKGYNLCRI